MAPADRKRRRRRRWPVYIDLADGAGGDQGLTDDQLEGVKTEVIVYIAAVDGDGTPLHALGMR